MRYMVLAQADPVVGTRLEQDPQGLIVFLEGVRQRFSPEVTYHTLGAKLVLWVVNVEEPAQLAAMASLVAGVFQVYPDVYPVVTGQEFPEVLRRVGEVVSGLRPAA